jgi:hypothetical protein
MARVRSALRAVAMTWLVLQSAALVSTPVLLSLASQETEPECTCIHGANAICPMHHKPAPGSKICVIGSADNGLASLTSLFHLTSLAPVRIQPLSLAFAERTFVHPLASPLFQIIAPDPPPPRA